MKILWAPWRSEYIKKVDEERECFLCRALKVDEREGLVLLKGKRAFVILNKYPYNNGHVMVAPKKHLSDYLLLDQESVLEIHKLTQISLKVLKEVYSPHGFNLGYNLGRVAGAGLETHLHLHIVPRWNGDTNFMPVLSKTKVISFSLEKTYKDLKEAFKRWEGSL